MKINSDKGLHKSGETTFGLNSVFLLMNSQTPKMKLLNEI